ncbi:MAG TPA: ATP-binding protein [Flavilitoribacter sp.]|nr:ATP-binding protein [Flavilitoribacter sp.]HMQ88862.1 ATP-binding protein [Flavilitoribacter sp.]
MVYREIYSFVEKMIPRFLEHTLRDRLLQSSKVLILYGARQVGKTTLVKKIISNLEGRALEINADRQPFSEILSSRDFEKLKGLVSGYQFVFIDEAQRIPDIGINLKILHDNLPDMKIIVTGSSSLDLANRIKEPLTGRTWTYRLYPFSVSEWQNYEHLNTLEIQMKLEEWMRFGMYPEIHQFENFKDKRQYLEELTGAYLYKDILALANIRYPEKLRQLLKLLAFQIGSEVSIHELAISLQVNRETVINYIDLLEKAFVIFKLSGFSRNLRKEVTSMDKIYFYDLGVRNALIENFNPLDSREDTGSMWENFLLVERRKKMEYERIFANTYFWRTYSGAELDYIEERDGNLHGFEFKWKPKKGKAPATWLETYQNASYQLINRESFTSFIL